MRNRSPLIAAGAGLLVAVLVVLVLILPTSSKVKQRTMDIDTAKQDGARLTLQLQTLQGDQEQAAANRQKLVTLGAKVPPTADLPGLIRLLDNAAAKAGVDFTSMAPATPTASVDGTASVIPITITVNGLFFSVVQYLIELEKLPRAVKIEGVNVSQGAMASLLTVNITANFFTSDLSTGPGAAPGTGPGQTVPPSPSPTPTPTQTTTPTPTGSQSPSP
jgi:Tfp pilus assembly protein PilO